MPHICLTYTKYSSIILPGRKTNKFFGLQLLAFISFWCCKQAKLLVWPLVIFISTFLYKVQNCTVKSKHLRRKHRLKEWLLLLVRYLVLRSPHRIPQYQYLHDDKDTFLNGKIGDSLCIWTWYWDLGWGIGNRNWDRG